MTRHTSMATSAEPRMQTRAGRPFVYTLTEGLVLILIGLALIASAAVPAAIRHPHVARAYEKGTSSATYSAGR